MTDEENCLQLDAIDKNTQQVIQKLFQHQLSILCCAYHLLYVKPNYFVADDGSNFRFRPRQERRDVVRVTAERKSSAVCEPALTVDSTTCIRSMCVDPKRGAFPQAWAPLRKWYGLGLGRGSVFDGYARCFRSFLREVYCLDKRKLPSGFFNYYYNVDHVVPAVWLLRPLVRLGKAPDPIQRENTIIETADAISRGEIVEYVSLMLVPATVNQAWGGFERRLGRSKKRFGSLGGGGLPSLAKALGIMPPPSPDKEAEWTASLIVTLTAYGLFGEGEDRILLSGEEFKHLGDETQLLALKHLDVSPLVTRWLTTNDDPSLVGINGQNGADVAPTCGGRYLFVDGQHLIKLDHPGMLDILLASSDDLQEAKDMALVFANEILVSMKQSTVDRLNIIDVPP